MPLFGLGKKKEPQAQSEAANKTNGNKSPTTTALAADAPLEFSDKVKASARKWFTQAKKLTDDRNYDYAIESFLGGLKFWPEAVEEGHQLLRVASYSRWERGGKKPGALEAMKHPMSGRDALQAMLNAEWLWTHDPNNVSYMGGFVKNAARAKCEETLLFVGPIFFEACKNDKKPSKDRFAMLRKAYEELGARCERRGEFPKALAFFEGALTVLQVLQNLSGQKREFGEDLTHLATNITILKGKYDSAEGFQESLKDSKGQKDLHDRERLVIDEKRLDQLIAEARTAWQANPDVSAKLFNLVNLLGKAETAESEDEATQLLEQEYTSTDNYSYKVRADDIRLRKLRRATRNLATDGDKSALKQAKVELLGFELKTYKERVERYPTDNGLKFEYGKQLMQARRFDDAIPILQAARNDPKNRIACMNFIGRCFFEKGFHAQGISTYEQAIQEHDLEGDELSKELHYWLGRVCEASEKSPEAQKAFGQLIQWDYNYRDVRQRLEALANVETSKRPNVET